jgi:hypothetical protein
MADPATFAVIALQHLSDRQGDQFTVAEQGLRAMTGASRHYVIVDQHVQCGQDGVQFFPHALILNTLRPHPR